MSFLDRLERRFGAWAIPQFALFIVMANGLIYLLTQAQPDFPSRLMLNPDAIRQGEVWRVLTFLFVPPRIDPLSTAFWLLLLYQCAQALEHEWGDFRFCVFYGIGALVTALASLASGIPLSNVPLNITLLLAFATLFPNFQLLLFFIIPVKIKYLAAATWLGIAWTLATGSMITRVAIGASLVNYALFFGSQIWDGVKLRYEVYRNRRRFRD